MLERLHKLRRWAGIDRAVFYSNAGQLIRLLTGPVTILLVVKYLSPELQGYFYAFAGIVAMQIFLDMGFSQNILQFASHEFAKLKFTEGGALTGDEGARSRLVSLGRLSFFYYGIGALAFLVAVGAGGHIFFAASSGRFSAASFKSLPALAEKLSAPPDRAAAVIAEKLPVESRAMLRTYLQDTNLAAAKKTAAGLAEDFNKLIRDQSLFGAVSGPGFEPSPQIAALGRSNPQGQALGLLNRRILEEIFPAEITGGNVRWQLAWWIIVIAVAGTFALQPAWCLLSGCNQVVATARFTLYGSVANFAVNAVSLVAGAGIFVPAINAVFTLLTAAGYLFWAWRPFFRQFLERPRHGEISWKKEIWPLQWRIAVSWGSGYFIFDIVNPLAFYFCGAVEAGRLGMSLQMARMVYNIAMNWLHTRAPRFGALIAARGWAELDALLRRSTVQAFGFGVAGMAAFVAAVPLVGLVWPQFAVRLGPFAVNAWLGGGLLVMILTNAMAMELRAYKREPFMWYSIANAAASALFMWLFVRWWGIAGEAAGYALGIWIVFPLACRIYFGKRPVYRQAAEAAGAGGFPSQ